MPDSILNVFLADLARVRIVCRQDKDEPCGGVVELPIDALDDRTVERPEMVCPRCGKRIKMPSDLQTDYLELLGKVVRGLKRYRRVADVEFVLRRDAKDATPAP